MSMRLLRVAALAAAVTATAAAQSTQQRPQPQGTFKSGSAVIVSMFATVTDADRRLVPGLGIDDFEIFDNDKSQATVIFDNKIQPITVIVMLDTSLSMTNSLPL